MQILSFDCGLRNLAAVVLRVAPGFAFGPEHRTYASLEETAEQFKERAMTYFLLCGWTLEGAKLVDVSETLGRPERVKNIKKLSLMNTAEALYASLLHMETEWFADAAPDIIAVEVQHNANAHMRAVSLAIPVFFKRSMADSKFVGVSGGQKLKLCAAVGVAIGDGLVKKAAKKTAAAAKKEATAAKKAAAAAKKPGGLNQLRLGTGFAFGMGAAAAPEFTAAPTLDLNASFDSAEAASTYRPYSKKQRWGGGAAKTASGLTAKEKYEDNKNRSIMAMREVVRQWKGGVLAPLPLLPLLYDPNITDALLQAVWVLWTELAPRAPSRAALKRAAVPPKPKSRKRKLEPETEEL